MTTFKPVVLIGPSGSGKSTLLKKLMAEYKDCFAFSVSHTTRSPRPGEMEGKDYHFVSREDMKTLIEEGAFIEYACFCGNMYGTSKQAVKAVVATGKICILDIGMQGVQSLKQTDLNPRFIFIKPPSLEVLEQRMSGRGTETAESLAKRLSAAQAELEHSKEDAAYDDVIINDDLEVAYGKLKDILLEDIKCFTKQQGAAS